MDLGLKERHLSLCRGTVRVPSTAFAVQITSSQQRLPSFLWLCGSEQGTLQRADQPAGVGSGHTPCVPFCGPGELLQPTQPCDVSDSHTQTPKPVLHSSSLRPSQKAQSRLLRLETLQHRAALFPGSGGARGQRELGRQGARAQGGFPCSICSSSRPSPLPVLAQTLELKFTSPSFKTNFGLGCWLLLVSTLCTYAFL